MEKILKETAIMFEAFDPLSEDVKPYKPPYFLMILDHPEYYVTYGQEGSKDASWLLSHRGLSSTERELLLHAMHEIGIATGCSHEMHDCRANEYAKIIREICNGYKWGTVPIYLLEDLFSCRYSGIFGSTTRPFFMLHHSSKEIKSSLDQLIAIPTIPCGVKRIAQQVKDGTFLTQQEIEAMEKYRIFRKTYFRLYETIEPYSKIGAMHK